jgi:N-acyl-D-amino-acid deacylase
MRCGLHAQSAVLARRFRNIHLLIAVRARGRPLAYIANGAVYMVRLRRKTLFILAAALLCLGAGPPNPAFDLVIRNGRVLDGAGNPWVRADVAIKNGRFVQIGLVDGRGTREIDAHGAFVSPGWIDVMDQSGAVLQTHGLAENKVGMGVTTLIAGEAGTPVPAAQIDAYLTGLQQRGISVNFGTYYASSQARVDAMGDAAGAPNAAQMDKMRASVDLAMRGGAFGITSALIYPPSSFQTTEDLIELAKVAAKHHGIYATHMRDESAGLLSAIDEAIDIGEAAGIEVEIFHLKAAYQPGWGTLIASAGQEIEQARTRGVDVAADMYPYTAGGTGLDATVPSWVFKDGFKTALARLADPKVREQLKREVAVGSEPGWSNLVEASGGWKGVVLGNAFNPAYDRFRNQSLAAIGAQLGRDPADVAWDILIAAQPHRAVALYFMMDEKDIQTALRYPWVSIGSDSAAIAGPGQLDALGLPHPRAFGNFPRVIAQYVRKDHVLTLEDAVRKMTSWPASRMRLYDRGVIRVGLKADVTIFDYAALEDRATYSDPTAAPSGIEYVLVNGVVVVDRATPGRRRAKSFADPDMRRRSADMTG